MQRYNLVPETEVSKDNPSAFSTQKLRKKLIFLVSAQTT